MHFKLSILTNKWNLPNLHFSSSLQRLPCVQLPLNLSQVSFMQLWHWYRQFSPWDLTHSKKHLDLSYEPISIFLFQQQTTFRQTFDKPSLKAIMVFIIVTYKLTIWTRGIYVFTYALATTLFVQIKRISINSI